MAPADASGSLDIKLARSAWYGYDSGMQINGVEILPSLSDTYQIRAGGTALAPFATDPLNSGTTRSTTASVATSGILDPAPTGIYQHCHEGTTSVPLKYQFSSLLPGGSYILRLHFNEFCETTANARLMDIRVNGAPAVNTSNVELTGYDVFTTACSLYGTTDGSNKAVVEEILATADDDGNITVEFANHGSATHAPQVCGLEVVPSLAPVYQLAVGGPSLGVGEPDPETYGAFIRDDKYPGGTPPVGGSSALSWSFPTAPVLSDYNATTVGNAAPKSVYTGVRIGDGFTYTFNKLIPWVSYRVRLHFFDAQYGVTAGNRVMDVKANGTTVISGLDIMSLVGTNKPYVKDISVTPDPNGLITLRFCKHSGSAQPPVVSGIEIMRQVSLPYPNAVPTSEPIEIPISTTPVSTTTPTSGP